MHEVLLFLHLSLMIITPLSRSRLHVILSFISHFIHISIGVMVQDSLPCFISYNSCRSHSHIPYKHAIIIQGPHIVTCIFFYLICFPNLPLFIRLSSLFFFSFHRVSKSSFFLFEYVFEIFLFCIPLFLIYLFFF